MYCYIVVFLLCLWQASAQTSWNGSFFCYWQSDSSLRANPLAAYDLATLDPTVCSHLLMTFAGIRKEDGVVLDPVTADSYETIRQLRTKNPDLKVILAVGGGTMKPGVWSRMANNSEHRTNFVNSLAWLAQDKDLDGFDIDWEFPGWTESDDPGRDTDKDDFVLLLEDMKVKFDKLKVDYNKIVEITVAIGPSTKRRNDAYDFDGLTPLVDYFLLMSYDMRMFLTSQPNLGHHALLYPSKCEPPKYLEDLNVMQFVDDTINAVEEAEPGATSKLILGVGAYGKQYSMTSRAKHNVFDPSAGPGQKGPFLDDPRNLAYSELCHMIPLSPSPFEMHWADDMKVPYAFNDVIWVGYDNEESCRLKVDFAKEKGLGGMMIWSIDMDDCKNFCGGWYECPIMTAIRQRLDYWKNPPAEEE